MANSKELKSTTGSVGEDIAAKHLKKLGCRILKRNVRIGADEIDIVARDRDGVLLLVEVKSMKMIGDGLQKNSNVDLVPEDNYTGKKRKKFHRACEMFVAKHPELLYGDGSWQTVLLALTLGNNNVMVNIYENV